MKTFIVDAFTNKAFSGNQAGVCLVDFQLDEGVMLQIAQELGYSETAFVQASDRKDSFSIRYFSPKLEIPLCGHATMASAKVLFQETDLELIYFHTFEGIELKVLKAEELIEMEFPVYSTSPCEVPKGMPTALGLSEVLNSCYNKETNIILLEIASSQELAALAPDIPALLKTHDSIHGVLITAPGHDDYDFHSRFFWPWAGTDEDPVTGGTHTFLTGYWAERLDKRVLKSYQSSKRGGFMEVELTDRDTVLIKSDAVIVFRGETRKPSI